MREFKHFSYHTEYSCTGSYTKKINRTACFADAFRNVKDNSDITYTVQFYKGTEFQKRTGDGSACIVTKEQINYILNSLNRIYNFFFKISEYTDNMGYEKYKVIMNIKNVPATFHKFVLTNLRCVYEFPHNLLLYDAFILKGISPFHKENIFNLLNLTFSCSYDSLHTEHLPIRDKSLHYNETVTTLRKKIKKAKYLYEIYKEIQYYKEKIPFEKKVDEDTSYCVRDIEYWTTGFAERIPVYRKAYIDKKAIIKSKSEQKNH